MSRPLATACVAVLFLFACGGSPESKLEGDWQLDSERFQQMEEFKKETAGMPEGAAAMMAAMLSGLHISFHGGECSMTDPSQGTKKGSYVIKDSAGDTLTLAMTMDGKTEEIKVRFEGDALYLDASGQGVPFKEMPFKRKS